MLTRRSLAGGLLAAGMALGARANPRFTPGFNLAGHHALTAPPGAKLDWWLLSRTVGGGEAISLVWASVRGARAQAAVTIKTVERRGPARALYESVEVPGAVAMVNGSFFEGRPNRDERPMGLVRIDGHTLYPPSGRTGGGFLIAEPGRVRIVPRVERAEAEAAHNAIESSPILIRSGVSGMRSDDFVRADRVAVGSLEGGGVAIVGAFAVGQDCVSLWQFERLARAAAERQGAAFTDLIAMDGGPSAHIRLPGSGNLFGTSQSIYLTNVVALTLG